MKPQIHIQVIETNKSLPKKEATLLRETIRKHAKKAMLALKIPKMNITVYSNSKFAIPETGEGGYAPSNDWVHIYIDPTKNKKELINIINNVIPSTIYHELNHASRWQNLGYGVNLPEVLVTEGMAIVFAEEQWKKFSAPWADFSEKELDNLLNIFKKSDKKNYDHGEWFYGTGRLPRWIGYKIGSHIMHSFREKNNDIKWEKIVTMSAEKIIKMSGVRLGSISGRS